MKLIIFTGLLAACTGASLEHLEKKQISYLPAAKGSSSSPSKDSDVAGSIGDDTNAIGTSSVDQPDLSAHSFVPSKPNSSSDKDFSSSATDSEFAGYFYGPGNKNAYNQQSNLQARSQFGTQTPNQQFNQQGSSKYPSQQNRNQVFSAQGPSQRSGQQAHNRQFGQQQQNHQFGQQAHSQHFGQQPHNEQFSQQMQTVSQQQQNQQFGQQAHSQNYGQQPLSQQLGQQLQSQEYFQQAQNQQFGHNGSQVDQQDAYPQSTNNFGAQDRYQPRPSFANNQNFGSYSSLNSPQQPFDEETGYHY